MGRSGSVLCGKGDPPLTEAVAEKREKIHITTLPGELWHNRKLILRLAVNDFKKRYAGSYLGIIWAFVQPVVTVLLYWLVFDVIFKTRAQMAGNVNVPYVLFLTAGLTPWFFFMEALSSGTMSLIEYNYLVKKVVFKISILPLIKVISALFVHLAFVLLMIAVAAVYGFYPTPYLLQLPYYMLCLFVFVLALCYTTCAVQVFFRDLSHLISIALQFLQWGTPILWSVAMVPERLKLFVRLNPMVYIVTGYRECVYEGRWFFEHHVSTPGFWLATFVLFFIGARVFKRCKPHFADIL